MKRSLTLACDGKATSFVIPDALQHEVMQRWSGIDSLSSPIEIPCLQSNASRCTAHGMTVADYEGSSS
ncbi:MAG TPA: hypothetical protein VNH64_06455 [Parvularculaceae bacterium]|nr:hypothetical protein [Parvularculaceae bacterium]